MTDKIKQNKIKKTKKAELEMLFFDNKELSKSFAYIKILLNEIFKKYPQITYTNRRKITSELKKDLEFAANKFLENYLKTKIKP